MDSYSHPVVEYTGSVLNDDVDSMLENTGRGDALGLRPLDLLTGLVKLEFTLAVLAASATLLALCWAHTRPACWMRAAVALAALAVAHTLTRAAVDVELSASWVAVAAAVAVHTAGCSTPPTG